MRSVEMLVRHQNKASTAISPERPSSSGGRRKVYDLGDKVLKVPHSNKGHYPLSGRIEMWLWQVYKDTPVGKYLVPVLLELVNGGVVMPQVEIVDGMLAQGGKRYLKSMLPTIFHGDLIGRNVGRWRGNWVMLDYGWLPKVTDLEPEQQFEQFSCVEYTMPDSKLDWVHSQWCELSDTLYTAVREDFSL